VALANGGVARVLPAGSGAAFDERVRVGDLNLDTMTFPTALELQQAADAGDLMVSSVGSDPDGDGLVNALLAFGSRSIGIRDADGAPLWETGQRLVGRAAELDPSASAPRRP